MRLAPCIESPLGLSACGGVRFDDSRMDLRGRHWFLSPDTASAPSGLAGSLRIPIGASVLRAQAAFEGDSWRVDADSKWDPGPFSIGVGAARSTQGARMRIGSDAGTLPLPWNDRMDSAWVELSLPLASTRIDFSLGGSEIDPAPGNGATDSGTTASWRVALRRPLGSGTIQASLRRENRDLAIRATHHGSLFSRQQGEIHRAQAQVSWIDTDWTASFDVRQILATSPQSRLGRPTIHWNRLSDETFSPLTSLLSDRQDYLSGEFSLDAWSAELDRRWHRGPWTLELGTSCRFLSADISLRRTSLQITGFLPTVHRDTLADGGGWLLSLQPNAGASWNSPLLGQFRLGGSIALPVAGDRRDATNPIPPSATASNESSVSLPLDPLGMWSAAISWSRTF